MSINGAAQGLRIRQAESGDLEAIVALFAADEFSHNDVWSEANRPAYEAAFKAVTGSADTTLYAVLNGDLLIGTFLLTFQPVIYGLGAHRLVLEGVQVALTHRSHGVGRFILDFAERAAREKGAKQVVLTSNKKRLDAHRFYKRNGYYKSHDGFHKTL